LRDRIAGRLARASADGRLRVFLLALLGDRPRKNCRTIAEHAGDATETACGIVSARARRDTDGVAEDLRDHVVGHLTDLAAVMVIDEPGEVEKGAAPSALQRQHTAIGRESQRVDDPAAPPENARAPRSPP
jgi:SRSO17 transposase